MLIARKELTEDFYERWNAKFHKAATSIDKERLMATVAEELEYDFELIGSTAIEDKLQDDVGNTISDLKRAGIKVWVLTGDKVETAINIGFSCKLLNNHMNLFIINEQEEKELRKEIRALL